MKKSVKRVAAGALIAGAAGYVAGVLTAPKSGKATRTDLKNKVEKTTTELEQTLKQLHSQLSTTIDSASKTTKNVKAVAKVRARQVTHSALAAKEKVRSALSTLHEGDHEKRDLEKAVSEAQKAIEHLEKYIAGTKRASKAK